MSTEPADIPRISRLPRWWLAGAALLVVVATAVAGAFFVAGRRTVEGRPQAATVPGLPRQPLLLTWSMRRKPVTGWRLTAKRMGLPEGKLYRVVGNIGDRAFFRWLTEDDWWLVGIDVRLGKLLFAPVRLGPWHDGYLKCFVNGPDMVLCVREDDDPDRPTRAWVVDTSNGTVLFDGATDLRLTGDNLLPTQAGDYVVAGVYHQGIYGVGRRAELTWLVPGFGRLSGQSWDRDIAPSTLAVEPGSEGDVVFSLVDGEVVQPSTRTNSTSDTAIVYRYLKCECLYDWAFQVARPFGRALRSETVPVSLPPAVPEGSVLRSAPPVTTPVLGSVAFSA
jgi:hypothetical protein